MSYLNSKSADSIGMTTLFDILRELFRKINYKFKHTVLKKVIRAETGRDYAVAMLQEISEFPCHCEAFVGHRGCPSCLAQVALKDELLIDCQVNGDQESPADLLTAPSKKVV